jgi:serine/threonine protein phosphatase PrpC
MHHLPGGRIIVLVADGVSGATQSHIGASTAIRVAAQWLKSNLPPDISSTDWLMMFKGTAWSLTEHAKTLFGLEELDPAKAEAALATTLVCAVIEPIGSGRLRAHLVGVGDSGAWLLSAGQFTDVLCGKTSQSGVSSSAVVGLPRVPTELTPVVIEFQPGDVLLIGTDGIGDPLGSGEGGVGNLFRDILTDPGGPPSQIEFAHAVDFSRETFDDDRTLVAVWPKHVAAAATTAERRRPGMPGGPGRPR